MLPEERLSTAAGRSRVRAAARAAEGRLRRPADARQASGRRDLKSNPVRVAPPVLTERPFARFEMLTAERPCSTRLC